MAKNIKENRVSLVETLLKPYETLEVESFIRFHTGFKKSFTKESRPYALMKP